MLKDYQRKVVAAVEGFFADLDAARNAVSALPGTDPVALALSSAKYGSFPDRPQTGTGRQYPRVCLKVPTGGGKTLIAVEAIRAYQSLLAKRRSGLVVWITHREQIYRQTIENLRDRNHPYRQLLDQASGGRTVIVEKGQTLRRQDVEENLVVLMLMIQSAGKERNKIFEDSGGFTDFFPGETRYDDHEALIRAVPNLDRIEGGLFNRALVRTSLANVIRTREPLLIVDELHTMFTDNAKKTIDGLNPSAVIGLSATPDRGMNVLYSVSGQQLLAEGMIKLDAHLLPPASDGDWQGMLAAIKRRREELENDAQKLERNTGTYIRPIALIQVERTGKEQRGQGFVHSEDAREFLVSLGVPRHEIAVKSSSLDEIRGEKLLSRGSEVRYIITKEALKEGWDCSFAYILGVIPNTRSNRSMTQLIGRVLRQPYARKTGVRSLDESYVFFSSGQAQDALAQVQQGLKDEGLGDLSSGIRPGTADGPAAPLRQARIKPEVKKRWPESLFLPVWLVPSGNDRYRRFAYEVDILPKIDWGEADVSAWATELAPTIKEAPATVTGFSVGLNTPKGEEVAVDARVRFDRLYLTRRLAEVVGSPFVALSLAEEALGALKRLSPALLDQNAGYVAAELERRLAAFRKDAEKAAFSALLDAKKLVLAVSDDDAIGFEMPPSDSVATAIPASYRRTLYEDTDLASMNSLELKVAKLLDESPKVAWWARNRVSEGWYAIQGWRRGRIRPDFVAAKENGSGEMELVYVAESKGEQLAGNDDTLYKKAVFDEMNAQAGKVVTVKRRLTAKLNDRFEFELVQQNEEDISVRRRLYSDL